MKEDTVELAVEENYRSVLTFKRERERERERVSPVQQSGACHGGLWS